MNTHPYVVIAFMLFLCLRADSEAYYEQVQEWGVRGTNTGEFVYGPGAIAVDGQDRIFVMDAGASEIMVFTTSGLYLTNWPIRIEIGEEIDEVDLNSIAIDDYGNAFFAVMDLHYSGIYASELFGEVLSPVVPGGNAPGSVYFPNEVAIDSSSRLIVSDFGNYRIQVFNMNGGLIHAFGSHGTDEDKFQVLGGLAVDSNDYLFIADVLDHRIKKFTVNGDFIGSFGGGAGGFTNPVSPIIDALGNVVVGDSGNYRLQILSRSGEFIATITHDPGAEGPFEPSYMALDSQGNLYVTDGINNRIIKFAPTVSGPPVIADPTATNITATTAIMGGTVTDDGGGTIIERGVYWSTDEGFAPPGEGTKISETGEFGEGVFTVEVTDVPPGTNIYFRAFARHIATSGYSAEASFTTSTGSVIYVNSDIGDDAYDGYSPTVSGMTGPKATLAGAMTIAVSGDTIEMAAGDYPELPLTLNLNGRNISLRPNGTVTISADL